MLQAKVMYKMMSFRVGSGNHDIVFSGLDLHVFCYMSNRGKNNKRQIDENDCLVVIIGASQKVNKIETNKPKAYFHVFSSVSI